MLKHDIVLDETAFTIASTDMAELKARTQKLKEHIKEMYKALTTALDTPAGKKLDFTAEKVLLAPIENLLVVIEHISEVLTDISGTGYYKDVFIKFAALNDSVKI